jgi:HEAT repeat protein
VIIMVEQNEIQEWIGQLRSDDMDRQREASRRLGGAGERAVSPVIEALAASSDNDERWYLAVALARIGWPALDPLIAALRDRRDPEFRRYAAAALAELGEDAVDPLVMLLEAEDDPELRGFAAQALTRIGEPAIARLSEAVEAGGTLGAVAGLVLWRMEEPGLHAFVGVCCPEDMAPAAGPDARGGTGPRS